MTLQDSRTWIGAFTNACL